MAAVVERYIGVSITQLESGGPVAGTVTDVQASWNTTAQIWINTLGDGDDCYIYFAETQGNVAFYNWSPPAADVNMIVGTLFAASAVSITISQGIVGAVASDIIVIQGCYNLGNARTLNTKPIGGRLTFVGGKYYTILYDGVAPTPTPLPTPTP